MLFWLVFLVLLFSSSLGDLSLWSQEAQQFCLEKLSFRGSLADIYKALVCGKRLSYDSTRFLFVKGGLIHLTVVSGAHLLFLERFWKKIPCPSFLKTHGLFVILILYTLASGMHPPVVRALFSFFLFQVSRSYKFFWGAHLITFLSGVFCLIYQPSWTHSFSFQLSLIACFLFNAFSDSLKKSFFIYLCILPMINRWEILHPFTVLINWAFTPLISSLLFPLTFLSPFLPFFYSVADPLWSLVLKFLKLVNFLPPVSPLMKWYLPKKWIWPYISLICLMIFIFHRVKQRLDLYPKSADKL